VRRQNVGVLGALLALYLGSMLSWALGAFVLG
jgi:hypothetical protein